MQDHKYKICPECEFFCNYLEPDKYCSICNEELIISCPKCGQDIKNPYANYCRFCGEKYPGRKKVDKKNTQK